MSRFVPQRAALELSPFQRKVLAVPEDIDLFLEELDAAGVFTDVLSRQRDFDDEGLARATIDVTYTPHAVQPASEKGVAQ